MSTAEILAALSKLSPQERSDILARLWQLEEVTGPTPSEQVVLDEAQASYDADTQGASWTEVEARLRRL